MRSLPPYSFDYSLEIQHGPFKKDVENRHQHISCHQYLFHSFPLFLLNLQFNDYLDDSSKVIFLKLLRGKKLEVACEPRLMHAPQLAVYSSRFAGRYKISVKYAVNGREVLMLQLSFVAIHSGHQLLCLHAHMHAWCHDIGTFFAKLCPLHLGMIYYLR